MLPLAPTSGEDYSTVILLSAPPPLNTPSRYLSTVLCVRHVATSDPEPAIDPAPPAWPLSAPVAAPTEIVVAPNEPPWSLPPCNCCAICGLCTPQTVDPPQPPTVNPATAVSVLDDSDNDVTLQINHLTNEALRMV
jgi:hypothetical protein